MRRGLSMLVLVLVVTACASKTSLESTTSLAISTSATTSTVPAGRGLEGLEAYARLVNLVRFFHPSDQAAAIDWVAFIADTYQEVLSTPPSGLAFLLNNLLAAVAPTVRVLGVGAEVPLPPELVDSPPGAQVVGWRHRGIGLMEVLSPSGVSERVFYENGDGDLSPPILPSEPLRLEIGAGLEVVLPITLFVNDGATVPSSSVPSGWRAGPGMMLEWADYPREDEATRVAAVILAWGMFEHFYPYWDQVDGNWDLALADALRRAVEPGMPIVEVLRRMIAAADDGHAEVLPAFEGTAAPPIRWQMVEERLVVTYLTGGEGDVRVGDEVVAIEGVPVADALAQTEPLVSASTPHYRTMKALLALLQGTWGSDLTVTVRRADGVPRTVVLRRTDRAEVLPFFLSERRPEAVATVAPGMLYIDLTRVSDEERSHALDRIAAAGTLILDMRGYPSYSPGGSSFVNDLLPRLANQPIHSDVFEWPIRTGPGERFVTYEDVTWDIDPTDPHIDAEIAVLIDGRAISASETYLGIIEEYRLAALVGTATAGTNGNNLSFIVPGDITIGMTGLLVTNHDGSPHHGVGVVPTIPAERTVEGVRQGRDEILQAAIRAMAPTGVAVERCVDASRVVATYPVVVDHAWMVESNDPNLESWYFISAVVRRGPHDGEIATWQFPGFNPEVAPDPLNTPALSIPANDIALQYDIGTQAALLSSVVPENYGFGTWSEVDGFALSQQCAALDT